jgi:hypothetical protein
LNRNVGEAEQHLLRHLLYDRAFEHSTNWLLKLPPGGSMGPIYVLQLLLCGKITKSLITQQPPKLGKKMNTDLESKEF